MFGLVLVPVIGSGLAVNLPQLLMKTNTDPQGIAGVLSLFGVGQLLGRLVDFVGSRRFGLDYIVIAATLCSLLSWLLLLCLPATAVIVAIAVLAMGASNGLFTIVRGATPQLVFHGEQFIEASARMTQWGSYARAVAPFVVAWMVQVFPHAAWVASVCVLALLLGVWAVFTSARAALARA